MPNIVIYNSEIRTDFYPGESSLNYRANVHERINVRIPFTYDATFYSSTSNAVQIGSTTSGNTLNVIEFVGTGNWIQEGFVVGQDITISYTPSSGTPSTLSTSIIAINGGEIIIADDFLNPTTGDPLTLNALLPDNSTNTSFITIEQDAPSIQGVELKLNHFQGANISLNSLIDGEQNRFENHAVPSSPSAALPLTQLNKKSGGYIDTPTITVGDGNDYILDFNVVLPYGLFDQAINPQTSLYNGANTFNLGYEIKVIPNVLNLATYFSEQNEIQGNLGAFDEVFNGGQDNFTLEGTTWQDAIGNTLSALDYGQTCTFTTSLNNVVSDIDFSRVVINLWHVPVDLLYQNRNFNYFEDVMMNSFDLIASSSNTSEPLTVTLNSGSTVECTNIISNVSVSGLGGAMSISFDVDFDANSIAYFDENQSTLSYFLSVHVQEDGEDIETAKRVNKLLDYGYLIKTPEQGGEFSIGSSEFRDINNNITDVSTDSITEDTLRYNQTFTSNSNNADLDVLSIESCVVAYNTVTGAKFDLDDRFVFTFDGQQSNGARILVNNPSIYTRNYQTFLQGTFNQNRTVELDYQSSLGVVHTYELNYSFQNLWRYWELLQNANNDFLSNSQPQNGLNKDWEHYQLGDWEIKVETIYNVDSGLQYYYREDLVINDYKSNPDITADIVLYSESGVVATSLIAGQTMKLRVSMNRDNATVWDLENVWSEITHEGFESSPRPMVVSFTDGLTNNAFEGINNNVQRVENSLDNADATLYAEINVVVDDLPNNAEISFTGRVFDGTDGTGERVKKTFRKVELPRGGYTPREDRGEKCCILPKFEVRATDVSDSTNHKNNKTLHAAKGYDVGDSFVLKLYKDGELLVSNYAQYIYLPNDVYSFCSVIDWQAVYNAEGVGCYHVEIEATVSGVIVIKDEGYYNLRGWSLEESVNSLQVNVRTVYDKEDQVTGINFNGAVGAENSQRFNGFFGFKKINGIIQNDLTVNRRVLNSKRDNVNEYTCELWYGNEYQTERLAQLFKNGASFRITDYSANNHKQYLDIPVQLQDWEDGGFIYNAGNKANFATKLIDFTNNDRALWSGSKTKDISSLVNINVEGGDGGTCLPAGYFLKNSDDEEVGSGNIPSGVNTDIYLPDLVYDVYVNGVYDQTVTIPAYEDEDINITA